MEDSTEGSAVSGLSPKQEDVMKEYTSSLEDLTVNSKPLINMLTILADENKAYARAIVIAVEKHLQKVPSDIKLPVLYLIDSIMKNVGKPYPSLFTQNIVSMFCCVFEKVDEKTRAQMFKLRHTWNNMFPTTKMYALDARVNTIDPAWPITVPPPSTTNNSIHFNPRFLQNSSGGNGSPPVTATPVTTTATTTTTNTKVATEESTLNEQLLRENLLKKKKELLELQQKKLELELLQTKKKLQEQEKQLEKTTVHLKTDNKLPPPLPTEVVSKKSSKSGSERSYSSSSSSSRESRKSRSQRKAMVAAVIAAAAAEKPIPTTVSMSTVTNTTAGTAGPVPSAVVQKSKPCISVAPVVTKPPVGLATQFTSTKAGIMQPDLSMNSANSGASPIKIAPVSTGLIKAVRSRDPRLRNAMKNEPPVQPQHPPAPHVAIPAAPVAPFQKIVPFTTGSYHVPAVCSSVMAPIIAVPPMTTQVRLPLPNLPSSAGVSLPVLSQSISVSCGVTVTATATLVGSNNLNIRASHSDFVTSASDALSSTILKSKPTDIVQDNTVDLHSTTRIPSPNYIMSEDESKKHITKLMKKIDIKLKNKSRKDGKSRDHRHKKESRRDREIKKHTDTSKKVAKDLPLKTNHSDMKTGKDKTKTLEDDKVLVSKTPAPQPEENMSNVNKTDGEPLPGGSQSVELPSKKTSTENLLSDKKSSPIEPDDNVIKKSDHIETTVKESADIPSSPKKTSDVTTERSPKKSYKERNESRKLSPRKNHSKKQSPSHSTVVSKNIEKLISQDDREEDLSNSSPPPVRSSSPLSDNDKGDKFKEIRASSFRRMKQFGRQREMSNSPPVMPLPPSVSPVIITDLPVQQSVTAADTDLRVPPIDDCKQNITSIEVGKDVDLRALTVAGGNITIPPVSEILPQPPKRSSAEKEIELPPNKKSKMEKFDELFGSEDTDMRQELVPPLPSPPPPPIITPLSEVDENSEERTTWAKYKQGKPDVYKSLHRHSSRDETSFGPYRRSKHLVDRLGRPLLYHRSSSHGGSGSNNNSNQYSRSGRNRSDHHEPDPGSRGGGGSYGSNSSRSHYNFILREAEEQYKSGNVSINTYNMVLKEVITMNELKKLDEAKRRDEQETSHWRRKHRDTVSPGSVGAADSASFSESEHDVKGGTSPSNRSSPHIISTNITTSSSQIEGPSETKTENEISNIENNKLDSIKEEEAETVVDESHESSEKIPATFEETNMKFESINEENIAKTDIDLRTMQLPPVPLELMELCNDETKVKDDPEDVDSKLLIVANVDSSKFDLKSETRETEFKDVEVVDSRLKDVIKTEEPIGAEFDKMSIAELVENKPEIKVHDSFSKSVNIDSRRIQPPEFHVENINEPSILLPPPFTQEVLKVVEDTPSPVLPDPVISASKDTDLRIHQIPVGLPLMMPSIDLPICPKVEKDFNEIPPRLDKDYHPDVEIDHPRSSRTRPSDFSRNKDESSRYPSSKKYSRYEDNDTESSQDSSQGPSMFNKPNVPPIQVWDQPPQISGPGPIGNLPPNANMPGPWMRPLLQPPPALMLQPNMEQNPFNPLWQSGSQPPPLMGQNMQPRPMQQIPPIRPPPPPPAGIFEQEIVPANVQYPQSFGGPPRFVPPMLGPPIGPPELPPADPVVLDMIDTDVTRNTTIDGYQRDIRYYGDTAVAMMAWDEPREVFFQGPPARLTIDNESFILPFNAPFRDCIINDQPHRIRLGGPTREVCIDNEHYHCYFSGPPIHIRIGGKMCKVALDGPPPRIRIGPVRTDLVVGRISLIVDAKKMVPIFLDPKPQRIDIDDVPYIFRFVEALETVVINGVPIKLEFGGLPKPIYSRGKKYFIRLSSLPQGIVPGYVNIINMEGGRRGSPPPRLPAAPVSGSNVIDPDQENSQDSDIGTYSNPVSPSRQEALNEDHSMPLPSMMDIDNKTVVETSTKYNSSEKQRNRANKVNPLDVLTSLIAPAVQTSVVSGYSYSVEQPAAEQPQTTQPEGVATQQTDAKVKDSGVSLQGVPLSIEELFQRLVATGMVPVSMNNLSSSDDKKAESPEKSVAAEETNTIIKPTDFKKPETLKIRQPGLVSILFSGIQCSSCGVRFPPEQTIKYSQHLDWHFRQNRRDRDSTRKAQSRKWYYDISDWIQFEEIEDLEERAQSWFDTQAQQNATSDEETLTDVPSVPCANGIIDVECEMCKDKFEQFYNEEKEEWHLRRAIKVDDKIYHPICYDDYMNSLKAAKTEREQSKLDETEVEETPVAEDTPAIEDDDDDVIIQEIDPKPVIIELLKDDDDEDEEPVPVTSNEADKQPEETSDPLTSDERSVDKDVPEAEIISEENTIDTQNDSLDVIESDNTMLSKTEIENVVKNIKKEPTDDIIEVDSIIDLERVVIKKEKLDDEEENLLPKPVVDTTHTIVACSIDGNVELEDSSMNLIAPSSKIKINISKPVLSKDTTGSVSDVQSQHDDVTVRPPPTASAVIPLNMVEPLQPPPPGEEPCPLYLKPRLVGKKLTELPPVSKGTELSGLCCIM